MICRVSSKRCKAGCHWRDSRNCLTDPEQGALLAESFPWLSHTAPVRRTLCPNSGTNIPGHVTASGVPATLGRAHRSSQTRVATKEKTHSGLPHQPEPEATLPRPDPPPALLQVGNGGLHPTLELPTHLLGYRFASREKVPHLTGGR